MAKVGDTKINLTPTEGMRAEARRYKAWKADGKPGGTNVAANRANQILSGGELSPDVVIQMNAWFARHEVDKKGKGFSPGDDYPSPGRVAWAAWGGDPGQTWSAMKSTAIKNAEDRAIEEIDEETYRAEPGGLKVGDFVEWNSSGGMARGKITRIISEGSVDVPDSSFTIDATEENPAALIRVYREDDGSYEETDRIVGHRFSTLSKIAALRFLEGKLLSRAVSTEFAEADDRRITFPFASETPVERYYGMEVLSMDEDSMDMSRLNDGAPLLYNHDADRIIGVVERAYIKKKRAYAEVKLANNDLGREMQELIKDGIIRNVSFGYKINEMEEDRTTTPVTYRATSYQPFEVSLVTSPADNSVGVGRAFYHNEDTHAASAVQSTTNNEVPIVDQTVNLDAIRAEASQAKAKELAEMIALGQRTKNTELAQEFISNSRGLDELRSALLEKMGVQEKPVNPKDSEIGLSTAERRDFSFLRAINAMAHPSNQELQRAAGFEIECSRAAQAKSGREARGMMIPADILSYGKRDLTVGTASAGGDLVKTELLTDSFIDLLRKALVLQTAGATVLTGLQGMIALPRQSGGASVFHVAESASITESQLTVDQVTMQPRTIGAMTDYSRRLLLQSSIDIENLIRRDLAQGIAIEIENQALNGTGSGSFPLGILNTTGINTESGVTTFADFVNAEATLGTDNALLGQLSYLMNSALRGTLKGTEKASGYPVYVYEGDNTINGYPALVSNSMPDTTVLFGNFSDLLIGLYSGLDLMVDPYTGSASGTVRIVAMQDYDVATRHPESFCKMS